jgi:hypothetical protein
VPVIAFLLLKDHPYWAVGGGLAVGIILALVVAGILLMYNEMLREEEKQQSQQAQVREAVKAGDAVDIAIVNMQKLDEYYTLNKNQARNSFLASITAVSVGFAAILVAARFSSDLKQALPGALGGVLLNFIGGGFFVMYNKSLEQLNLFYGKLVRLQDTMLAVQQCEKLPLVDAARVRESIIHELLRRSGDRDAATTRTATPKSGGKKNATMWGAAGKGKVARDDREPKHQGAEIFGSTDVDQARGAD